LATDADDPGFREYAAFMAKYMSAADFTDLNAVNGFTVAEMLIQVLRQCGDNLSRENIMRQAANLKDLDLPMLLPGIKINTSPDNFYRSGKCSSLPSTARVGGYSATS
jgi:branched-chain amino acid transport system substrate-binding protein